MGRHQWSFNAKYTAYNVHTQACNVWVWKYILYSVEIFAPRGFFKFFCDINILKD